MKIDALMTTWDKPMPTERLGATGSGGGTNSPFPQMLAALQAEAGISAEAVAPSLAAISAGNALPLTELLKALQQFIGETEARPDPIGELLLASNTPKSIPLMEAVAALQTLIAEQSASGGSDQGAAAAITEGEAQLLAEIDSSREQKSSAEDSDIGLEAGIPLLSSVIQVSVPNSVGMTPEIAVNSNGAGPVVSQKVVSQEVVSPTVQQLSAQANLMAPGTVNSNAEADVAADVFPNVGKPTIAPADTNVGPPANVPTSADGRNGASSVTPAEKVLQQQSVDPQVNQPSAFGATAPVTGATTPAANIAGVEAVSAPQNAPVVDQIVSAVELITLKGESEVRLRLHPKSLGQVLVQVNVSRGDVSIHMLAETSMGRAVIQDHLSQLREAFNAQGLNVDDLSVTVGNDPSAFDAPANQHEYEFQASTYQGAARSVEDDHKQAERRPGSSWLHSTHTVDYTV